MCIRVCVYVRVFLGIEFSVAQRRGWPRRKRKGSEYVIINIYMMMKEGTISSALWWSRREGLSKSQDGGQFIAAYWRCALVGMLLEIDVQQRTSFALFIFCFLPI